MTEWIVLLACIVIAAVVGFFLGHRKKPTASPTDDVDTSQIEKENKQLKDDYSLLSTKIF